MNAYQNRLRKMHRQMSDHILQVRLSKLTNDKKRHSDQIAEINKEIAAIHSEMKRRR